MNEEEKCSILCLFLVSGQTFTFRDVTIEHDNQTAITFKYSDVDTVWLSKKDREAWAGLFHSIPNLLTLCEEAREIAKKVKCKAVHSKNVTQFYKWEKWLARVEGKDEKTTK